MPGKTSFFNQSGLAGVGYSSQSVDSYAGEALNHPRVNAAEDSMEFRTTAELLADIGLEIGTDVQAYDADLDTWATLTPSANAQSLVTAATYAAMRTLLDLEVGTDFYSIAAANAAFEAADATILKDADIGVTVQAYDATYVVDADIGSTVQAYDADLTTWAGLTPSANAQSLVTAANYAAMRALLDLEIGVDVQAYDATYVVDADIGVTVQGYDADTAKLDVVNDWTAAQSGEVTALVDGANISVNLALSNNFSVTLAGNRTLDNPTNIVVGQSGLIKVTQDATGTRTLAYGTYYKFVGGTDPVLTTTASAVDTLSYYVASSTEILVSAALDWK